MRSARKEIYINSFCLSRVINSSESQFLPEKRRLLSFRLSLLKDYEQFGGNEYEDTVNIVRLLS